MLSAIAARKAAQAAQQLTECVPEDRGTSPSLHPESPEPATPIFKRKSSAKISQLAKKRKKIKQVKPRHDETRLDTFKDQEDVIPINSDLGDSDTGVSDLDGPGFLRTDLQIDDSSESDNEEPISGVPEPQLPIQAPTPAPYILTTCPLNDTTLFPLSRQETQALSPLAGAAALAVLPHGERICLLGVYAFTILKGSVTISGVTLPASRTVHHSFAPRSSPVPVMEGLAINESVVTLEELPSRLHTLLETQATLILFQELSTGIEGLGRVCTVFQNVFEPFRWQGRGDFSFGISGVHVLSTQTKNIQPLLLPVSWERAFPPASPDMEHRIYLVKGPKKSGKSTFARMLVNRLLTNYQRVAYLECDLGQSEFTPAGMVALNIVDTFLFGPSFTHPAIPFRAHYIGATTPRSSPSHYLDAIHSLIQSYRIDVQSPDFPADCSDGSRIADHIPLVVNTMGWTKGLGADLNRKIEDIIQPTDMFAFEPSPPNLSDYVDSGVKTQYLTPIAPSILSQNFTPADHRSLNILSYLHATFPPPSPKDPLAQIAATHWSTTLPLCAQPPWEVICTPTFQRVFLTGAGAEDVVPSELERVLNGALVALVTCDPDALDHDVIMTTPAESNPPAPLIPYIQGSSPPAPATSNCHGLALIRGVSVPSPSDPSRIHVLTPLPGAFLAQVNVLVKGELEIPVWGMLDFTHENGGESERNGVPYLRWGKGEGLGGEKRRVRRNLMRKGQM